MHVCSLGTRLFWMSLNIIIIITTIIPIIMMMMIIICSYIKHYEHEHQGCYTEYHCECQLFVLS